MAYEVYPVGGGGGGGFKRVATLDAGNDLATKAGLAFFVEGDGGYYGTEEYDAVEAEDAVLGTMTSRALADSDFVASETFSGSVLAINYVGPVSVLPAVPAAGTITFFWDITAGSTLGSGGIGSRLKSLSPAGTNGRINLTALWFDASANPVFIGDPAQNASLNYGTAELDTVDEVRAFLDANEDVRDLIDGTRPVLYATSANIFFITAHDAGTLAVEAETGFRLKSLGGLAGSASVTSKLARTQVLSGGALTAQDSSLEFTLTEDLQAGAMYTVEFRGTPPGYGIFFADDLLAKAIKTTNTGSGSGESIALKIHTPDSDGFSHDAMTIWRSASNKLRIKSARDSAETIDIWKQELNVSIDLEAAPAGEVTLADDEGLVKNVTAVGHPPEPTAGDRNIYINKLTGRIWVPHTGYGAGTFAAVTGTIKLPVAPFRGIRYVNPTGVQTAGDFYYNRNSHEWRIRRQGHYYGVTWAELVSSARNSADTENYFESTAVWLNEVSGNRQAAQIMDNIGNINVQHGYYYTFGGTLYRATIFVAGVERVEIPSYQSFLGGKNPVGWWYVNGQAERFPNSFPYTQDGSGVSPTLLRIQWSGNTPDETPFGWDQPVIWVDGDDVDGGDIDTGGLPALDTDHVVFQLPAGTWNIHSVLSKEFSALATHAIYLLAEIQSGTDDAVIAIGNPYQASNVDVGEITEQFTSFDLLARDIVTDGSKQFYFLFGSNTASVVNNNSRGTLRLEKVG